MDFKTLKEASDAFSELESSSNALLEESAEKIAAFEAAEVESKQAVAESIEKVESLEGEVESLKSEKAELLASNKELEENKIEVQEEAARIVAGSGIDPVETGAESAGEPSLMEQYNKLSGAAKTAFYLENKEAILALV